MSDCLVIVIAGWEGLCYGYCCMLVNEMNLLRVSE